jgi:hypothetical protein
MVSPLSYGERAKNLSSFEPRVLRDPDLRAYKISGSIPAFSTTTYYFPTNTISRELIVKPTRRIAQLEEHRIDNPAVTGSNPVTPTLQLDSSLARFFLP